MAIEITDEILDLTQYPKARTQPLLRSHTYCRSINIGDLHANPIKLIHLLVLENICSLPEEAYHALRFAYLKPTNAQAVHEFIKISKANLKVKDKLTLVRIFGNELAGRGRNDLLMLTLLSLLKSKGCQFEILLSNHGHYFLHNYGALLSQSTPHAHKISGTQDKYSFSSLLAFLEFYQNAINPPALLASLSKVIDDQYLPNLKLISYEFEGRQTGIILYSYAPMDIRMINLLAKRFNTPFSDNSVIALAQSIDSINAEFKKIIIANRAHELASPELINRFLNSPTQINEHNVITALFWGRETAHLSLHAEHNGYLTCFIHGHTLYSDAVGNEINVGGPSTVSLDSHMGKPGFDKGNYTRLVNVGLHTAESIEEAKGLLSLGLFSHEKDAEVQTVKQAKALW